MIFEELLYETLTHDSSLMAIVQKVYGPVLESANPLPALCVMVTSDNPEVTHSGDSGLTLMRVSFVAFASCHLQCLRVLFRIDQMFSARRGVIGVSQVASVTTKKVGNRLVIPRDPGSGLYGTGQDFWFYFQRSL